MILSSRLRRPLIVEFIESRICLSAVGFVAHDVFVSDFNDVSSIQAADLDNDGDNDLVVSSKLDGKLVWYDNVDGSGNLIQREVATSLDQVSVAFPADVDGDGDLDLLAGSSNSLHQYAVWIENIDAKVFGLEHRIEVGTNGVGGMRAADIDRDGDNDVVIASSSEGIVTWFENTDGQGNLLSKQVVTNLGFGRIWSMQIEDVDNDGDVDFLWASANNNTVSWHENMDGQGNFGESIIIKSNGIQPKSIFAQDLDGDGDLDFAAAFRGGVSWFENRDGQGEIWWQRQITNFPLTRNAKSVFVADLDGDGISDILSASQYDHKIAWYKNDGQGGFGNQQVISIDARSANFVVAADLDNDGDMDVASASSGLIASFENVDGTGRFGPLEQLSTSIVRPLSVQAVDFDGDRDLDVLSSSTGDGKITWYQNTDGRGNFGPQRLVATPEGVRNIFAADLDGDGDFDVISAAIDGEFAWYENNDGQGTFGAKQPIFSNEHDFGHAVYAMDADGDGDIDVFSSSHRTLAWYENTDGKGNFGPQQVIADNLHHGLSLYAADLNGDGHQDIMSTSWLDGYLFWHPGDGRGGFGAQQKVPASNRSIFAADADGDGDQDLFVTGDGLLTWHENMDGLGNFEAVRMENLFGSAAVRAVDMDGDGDVDLIFDGTYGVIAWYENIDGRGNFANKRVIAEWDYGFQNIDIADMDGDGDPDLVVAPYYTARIAWFENRPIGDSNGDGVFDSRDLIEVFIAGEFEDGISGNSTFVEGDWNNDGDFDSSDLVFAFQAGNYVPNAQT